VEEAMTMVQICLRRFAEVFRADGVALVAARTIPYLDESNIAGRSSEVQDYLANSWI
jgi:hypothetical protein